MRFFLAWLTASALWLPRMSAAAEGDALGSLRTGHPRLLLTDDGLASALTAAKTDLLRATLHQRIVATAEAILPAPPLRANDGQKAPEQERIAVYQILTCAMAFRLTGDERFAARAKNDLLTVAGFPDWDPRHDLAVGEMSFAVAVGYDWLHARLEPEARATIKRALVNNALAFADTSYARNAGWTTNPNNHNQVCNAGLVCAALALGDEEPALARRVLAGAAKSMLYGLSAYAPDGVFPEGPGYWTYGTTYSAITFAALESALGTELGLTTAPGFSRTILYYEAVQGPFGPVFNYADSTDDLQNSPTRAWLAERFKVSAALRHMREQLAEILARNRVIPFDRAIQAQVVNRFFALHAIWFPRELAAGEKPSELPLDFHFSGGADIAMFRSAWNDPRAIFVGFKAGENSTHHNHLDAGSFVLDADGQRWAVDLGPDVTNAFYDLPGYFDYKDRRWTYYRANNRSHNTVTPGEALQSRQVVAPIVAHGSEPRRAFAVADLTPVYSEAAASLRRGIALLDRARVLVQDEYRPARAGTPLRWQMVTGKKVALAADGRTALLTSEGRTLRVEILQPASARLQLASTRPPTAAENQNVGTTMLAIALAPDAGADVTRLAVLLTPIGDRWPRLDPPALQPLSDWR